MPAPTPSTPAVEVAALSRVFKAGRGGGEVVALAGIDLRIERGEIFGLLGPNGAGKTTCIKILTTLLFPTGGTARVAGHDVVAEAVEVRRRINLVSGGESSGYGILTVRECLWMFSQFYGVPTGQARERIERLIQVADLEEFAGSRINRLSTGQRQRMNFARGFVSDPEVLFLDEPTASLDPAATKAVEDIVQRIAAAGVKIVMATHDLGQARRLAGEVVFLARGRIVEHAPTNSFFSQPATAEAAAFLHGDLVI
jgi:ABC-2 type transport system ATP-binding protein